MTVYEIVREFLKNNGYDGLADGKGYGCALDNLMPCGCGENFVHCKPAHRKICKDCANTDECDLFKMYEDYPPLCEDNKCCMKVSD